MTDQKRMEKYFEDARQRLGELEEKLLALSDRDPDLDMDVELVDTKMAIKIRKPKAEWVISTNSGAWQIWIAAVGHSFKLDEDGKGGFVLKATGQTLDQVIEECFSRHFGKPVALG